MLEVKNLSAGNIINDISLDIPRGARMLMRGANGAGKTTLVRAIAGAAPASGKIILDGRDITDLATDRRARAGLFVGSQSVPEIPGLSIMTFLKHAFMATNGEVSMGEFLNKLKPASARLGIPDGWLARSVNVGFSGGEKKRLMFLHLLLTKPKMAMLDEPDSGADAAARKLFGEIIGEMTETTFLVISHQDAFFEPTAIAALQNGKLVIE